MSADVIENDHNFEWTEDCATVFLRWTEFSFKWKYLDFLAYINLSKYFLLLGKFQKSHFDLGDPVYNVCPY